MAITIDGAGTITGLDADGISSQPVFAGQVLQVVSTTKTDTFTASITNTFVEITGLSTTITPTSNNSKILVEVALTAGHQSTVSRSQLYQLARNGTLINVGDSAGSRVRISFATGNSGNSNRSMFTGATKFLDSPASTSPLTYSVKVGSEIQVTNTVHINRSAQDDDLDNSGRGVSSITLMEIAG